MLESAEKTSAVLLKSARKFREDACATQLADYALMMNGAAEHLERLARDLEKACDLSSVEAILRRADAAG